MATQAWINATNRLGREPTHTSELTSEEFYAISTAERVQMSRHSARRPAASQRTARRQARAPADPFDSAARTLNTIAEQVVLEEQDRSIANLRDVLEDRRPYKQFREGYYDRLHRACEDYLETRIPDSTRAAQQRLRNLKGEAITFDGNVKVGATGAVSGKVVEPEVPGWRWGIRRQMSAVRAAAKRKGPH